MEKSALATWNNLQKALKKFVYQRVRNRAISDDIIQDVFLKVEANLHGLKNLDKTSSWIYQITRNTIADHFRKNSKIIFVDEITWESDQHEFNECVANCLTILLKDLPEKYRIALELTDIENISQYELSKRLDISYAGARSRVQRARKMLRDKLHELFIIKTDSYGNIIVCEDRVECCSSCK